MENTIKNLWVGIEKVFLIFITLYYFFFFPIVVSLLSTSKNNKVFKKTLYIKLFLIYQHINRYNRVVV